MVYITGDTHGDFNRFNHLNLNDEDIMIILGDVGINYYLDEYDKKLKERLSETCDHQPFIAQAKMVLVFCADYQKWYLGAPDLW